MFSECRECREIKSINELIMTLVLRNLPANAGDIEKQVRSLGWADPLEEGMAIQSSTPMARGAWQATINGSQRVRHDPQRTRNDMTRHFQEEGTQVEEALSKFTDKHHG